MKRIVVAGVIACVFVSAGCERARDYVASTAASPPAAEEVAPYYVDHGSLIDVDVTGNVVELRVRQSRDQVTRGGALWARVGPFIYLMTPATRQVFDDFPGVAAVRVITLLPSDEEVARAMLRRDALSDVRWRRTLNLLGRALAEGQESPRRLEELTDWGEQHTEFSYNPRYAR